MRRTFDQIMDYVVRLDAAGLVDEPIPVSDEEYRIMGSHVLAARRFPNAPFSPSGIPDLRICGHKVVTL